MEAGTESIRDTNVSSIPSQEKETVKTLSIKDNLPTRDQLYIFQIKVPVGTVQPLEGEHARVLYLEIGVKNSSLANYMATYDLFFH